MSRCHSDDRCTGAAVKVLFASYMAMSACLPILSGAPMPLRDTVTPMLA
jgi:hypothetical protein